MSANPQDNDTISAIATAPGRGSIGIVRVSGPKVKQIAEGVLGSLPPPRQAVLRVFRDHSRQAIDSGIALFFPAPDSFTGEDVLELQGHGGREVLRLVHQRTVDLGARSARPGEFSERSFVNDKIDLVQAEAIADLIDAASTQAARSAMRSLQGAFSEKIHALVEELTGLRVNIEAAIDFADEDISPAGESETATNIALLQKQLADVREQAAQGALVNEGMRIVITGKPNAGKSSLLNALAGMDTAIVTDTPGTTRDLLSADIVLDGLPLQILDTAGLRDSTNLVEKEGVRRARAAIATADRVLLVIDCSKMPVTPGVSLPRKALAGLDFTDDITGKITVVVNKVDLLPSKVMRAAVKTEKSKPKKTKEYKAGEDSLYPLFLSAKTGKGMDGLRQHLADLAGFQPGQETAFTARARHLEALDDATKFLDSALAHSKEQRGSELIAEDLRLAQQALGRITGTVTADDLLGEIFSSFCIGK